MAINLLYAYVRRNNDYYLVNGAVILKNLSYYKQVCVHHSPYPRAYQSPNCWSDCECNFNRSLSENNELWNFYFSIYARLNPYTSSQCTQFALKYTAFNPHQIFWDNNSNRNYLVGVEGRSAGYEFPDIAIGNPAMLINASLNGSEFKGRVAVKNLAYRKRVIIRYTTDDWRTYKDLPAYYLYNYNPNDIQVYEGEVWGFKTTVHPYINRIIFAINYKFLNNEYWDNNLCNDYYLYPNKPIEIINNQ